MSNYLESLFNEILLEIFERLDGASFCRSFINLNLRFNLLLFQLHIKRIDIRSITKTEFDLLCKRIQPAQVIESIRNSRTDRRLSFVIFAMLDINGKNFLKIIFQN